uniref:Calmodulin n=1 Tax=Trepomonas sp. PC1 TaxID=1076344 RepID=A0A146KDJ1_9EUKA|eukprot:JAP93566.1 Calmodulin [Trepomonas sp. PC1]
MTTDEINAITENFDKLEKNELTASELVDFLKQNHIQMPIKTIKAIIVLSDDNNDQKISKQEFRKVIQYIAKSHSLAETLFHVADTDNSMTVSRKEMEIFNLRMGWNIVLNKEQYTLEEFQQMVSQFLVE